MILKLPIKICATLLVSFLLLSCSGDDISISRQEIPLVGFTTLGGAVVFSPGDTQNGEATLDVRLSDSVTTDVTVSLSVSELGSATNNEFVLNQSEITIPAGKTFGSTTLTVFVDAVLAENEGVSLIAIIEIDNVAGGVVIDPVFKMKAIRLSSIIPEVNVVNLESTFSSNETKTWSGSFQIQLENEDSWYGLFYQNASLPTGETFRLKLEGFGKPVFGTRSGNDLFITPLSEGDEINAESTFAEPENTWPDLPTIASESFQDWRGTTSYIGIQFPDLEFPALINYGWLQVEVNTTGDQMTLLAGAYKLGGIKAGQTE